MVGWLLPRPHLLFGLFFLFPDGEEVLQACEVAFELQAYTLSGQCRFSEISVVRLRICPDADGTLWGNQILHIEVADEVSRGSLTVRVAKVAIDDQAIVE